MKIMSDLVEPTLLLDVTPVRPRRSCRLPAYITLPGQATRKSRQRAPISVTGRRARTAQNPLPKRSE
jgi:hypothetical protein